MEYNNYEQMTVPVLKYLAREREGKHITLVLIKLG